MRLKAFPIFTLATYCMGSVSRGNFVPLFIEMAFSLLNFCSLKGFSYFSKYVDSTSQRVYNLKKQNISLYWIY